MNPSDSEKTLNSSAGDGGGVPAEPETEGDASPLTDPTGSAAAEARTTTVVIKAHDGGPDVTIHIDGCLENLMRRLTDAEREELRRSLEAEGCRDPLRVWKETGILLDGHTRLELCRELGILPRIDLVSLPDWEAAEQWIIDNQIGRRNLTNEQLHYLIGREYNRTKQPHGGDRRKGASRDQTEQKPTATKVAEKYHTSPATAKRAGRYAENVDAIIEAAGSEVRAPRLLTGPSPLKRDEAAALVEDHKDPAALKAAAKARLARGKTKRTKTTPTAAAHVADDESQPVAPPHEPAADRPESIVVPVAPASMAAAIVEQLGREQATEVHAALGRALEVAASEGDLPAGGDGPAQE